MPSSRLETGGEVGKHMNHCIAETEGYAEYVTHRRGVSVTLGLGSRETSWGQLVRRFEDDQVARWREKRGQPGNDK